MKRVLRVATAIPIASAGTIGLFGLVHLPDSFASNKAPTCSTVSVSMVKSAFGGSPVKAKAQTQNSTLACNYGTTTIAYRFKQTSTLFNEDRISQVGTKVSGIGTGAYSSSLTGTTELSVLTGSVVFTISGTETDLIQGHPVTLTLEEKLAKKIVPLA